MRRTFAPQFKAYSLLIVAYSLLVLACLATVVASVLAIALFFPTFGWSIRILGRFVDVTQVWIDEEVFK